ncbi:MAG: hypothetical protein KBT67_03805 [bacterium]|nr:hypothetical protein [Candidatus Limimorpha caballi]
MSTNEELESLEKSTELINELTEGFEEFLSKYYQYVFAHGERHHEMVYFKDIPVSKTYRLSIYDENRKVTWIRLTTTKENEILF